MFAKNWMRFGAGALACLSACQQHPTQPALQSSVTPTRAAVEQTAATELASDASIDLLEYQEGNRRMLTQRFYVPANRVTIVTASKGLKVTIDPAALETLDGKAVTAEMEASIVELTKTEDFFKVNAATESNGRLLESDGSYWIRITSAGKELRIRKGKCLWMEFPRAAQKNMELFYGQRNAAGEMNWIRAGYPLAKPAESVQFDRFGSTTSDNRYSYALTAIYKPDSQHVFRSLQETLYYKEKPVPLRDFMDTLRSHSANVYLDTFNYWPKDLPTNKVLDTHHLITLYGPYRLYRIRSCQPVMERNNVEKPETPLAPVRADLLSQLQDYYAPAAVSSLGWINCDRFNEDQPAEMQFQFAAHLSNVQVAYFLLFPTINGMLQGSAESDLANRIYVNQLPAGRRVKVIAFTKKNGAVYEAITETDIRHQATVFLPFKEISVSELNKRFGRNWKG